MIWEISCHAHIWTNMCSGEGKKNRHVNEFHDSEFSSSFCVLSLFSPETNWHLISKNKIVGIIVQIMTKLEFWCNKRCWNDCLTYRVFPIFRSCRPFMTFDFLLYRVKISHTIVTPGYRAKYYLSLLFLFMYSIYSGLIIFTLFFTSVELTIHWNDGSS